MIISLKSLTSSSGNQASVNNASFNVLIQSTASQLDIPQCKVAVYSTLLRSFKMFCQFHNQLYTSLTQHGIAKYQNTVFWAIVLISVHKFGQIVPFAALPISACTHTMHNQFTIFQNLYIYARQTGYSWWTMFKFGSFSPSVYCPTLGCYARQRGYSTTPSREGSRHQHQRQYWSTWLSLYYWLYVSTAD